jgi:tetrahydromethanopterin S-methyltransferase subunit F
MQALSERYATQIFGLAMGAVFAAMLILNAVSY